MQTAARSSRNLSYAAFCVSLMAVCSWIAIPAPVPFTLQTFAVFSTLCLLGGRLGTLAIASYLALGFVGLPIFSNGMSGPGVLFGATGGYLIGFLFMGLLYWLFTALFGRGRWIQLAALLLGLLLLYAFGSLWFMHFYLTGGGMNFAGVLSYCVLPFILPDLLKLSLALLVAGRVQKQVRFLPPETRQRTAAPGGDLREKGGGGGG